VIPSSFKDQPYDGKHRGAIPLYRHSHGGLPGAASSLDVEVDCYGFTPVTRGGIRLTEGFAGKAAKPMRDRLTAAIPTGINTTVEEVAELMAFLASPAGAG
jgi:hypothetical protein